MVGYSVFIVSRWSAESHNKGFNRTPVSPAAAKPVWLGGGAG